MCGSPETGLPRDDSEQGLLSYFDMLVEKYHRRIYNVVFRYLGDAEEASDLTQEVFLRAYQAFSGFRGEAAVGTWLHRIAINLSLNRAQQLDRLRRQETQTLDAPLEFDSHGLQRELADWRQSPERLAEGSELNRLIQDSLQSLSPEHRAVVVLRDLQGLSYAEIAEITGVSLQAVKSRLFRARSRLQALLQPYLTEAVFR